METSKIPQRRVVSGRAYTRAVERIAELEREAVILRALLQETTPFLPDDLRPRVCAALRGEPQS